MATSETAILRAEAPTGLESPLPKASQKFNILSTKNGHRGLFARRGRLHAHTLRQLITDTFAGCQVVSTFCWKIAPRNPNHASYSSYHLTEAGSLLNRIGSVTQLVATANMVYANFGPNSIIIDLGHRVVPSLVEQRFVLSDTGICMVDVMSFRLTPR